MPKARFFESLSAVSKEVKIEVDWSFAIAEKLDSLLKERGLTQKQFAKMTGKTEPEITRWLSGTHNFTLRTLAKISAALDVDILQLI